ncbi:Alpha/Beta hydrolase protein [Fomes fomentarius]|nr:Alpha/Beta hydrolase protein [Fomes fomentarius]
MLKPTNYILRLPDSGLFVSANHYYTVPSPPESSEPQFAASNGLTLVFAHCSSAHKEQWETTIERLFHFSSCATGPSLPPQRRIRDAWTLDAQNHGDSAILNKEILGQVNALTIQEYAGMLRFFVTSKLVQGRTIVAVGHSASTSAWTIACAERTIPNIRAIILVEPVMVTPPIVDHDTRIVKGETNVAGVLSRRHAWSSRAALLDMLKKRYPWKIWDERIFEAYLKHGFVEHHDASGRHMITTKCSIVQEVGFYYADGHVAAGHLVQDLCARYPVHAVFSERPEMVSLESRKSICDVSQGRKMASVSIVPRCGHLAVQENPDGVADAIFHILLSSDAGHGAVHTRTTRAHL